MSKKITYKQGDIEYELGGGLGSWAKSLETVTVNIGDVRVIGKKLMCAFIIRRASMWNFKEGRDEVCWMPVDDAEKQYLFPDIKKWMDSL